MHREIWPARLEVLAPAKPDRQPPPRARRHPPLTGRKRLSYVLWALALPLLGAVTVAAVGLLSDLTETRGGTTPGSD